MIKEMYFVKPEKNIGTFLNREKGPIGPVVDIEKIVLKLDPTKADKLINDILGQIEIIETNGFEPDRLILGLDNYEILTADVCYRIGQVVKPEEFRGIKISIVPDNYCKVVANTEDEFLYRDSIRKRGGR